MIRRGILVLTLLLAGTSTATAKTIPEWVADLGHKSSTVRLAARSALIQMKSTAVIAPIAAALPGFDYSSRIYAQGVLNALPPAKTRGLFRSLLKSGDPELRTMGATSLYRQGDPAGVCVLARDIRDETIPEATMLRVLMRLYAIRHQDVSAAIRDRLKVAETRTILWLLLRLISYSNDVAAIPLLLPRSNSEHLEVRLRVRALLYRLGHREVQSDLAKDLADPEGSYAALNDALQCIQTTRTAPDSFKKALVARLEAGDDALSAARILGMLTAWTYRRAIPVAEKLLEDGDARVQKAAFTLISKLAGRSQLDALRRSLENGTDPIRILAADALRRFDDESGLSVLIELLKSSPVTERRDIARVLGGFRRRESIPPLIRALTDEDLTVATYALTGVQQVMTALFPYRRFDWVGLRAIGVHTPADRKKLATTLRAWWESLPKE